MALLLRQQVVACDKNLPKSSYSKKKKNIIEVTEENYHDGS